MTNLAQFSSFFKKILIIVAFISLILVLAGLIFLRTRNKDSTPSPTAQSLPKPNIQYLPHQVLNINTADLTVEGTQIRNMAIFHAKPADNLLVNAQIIAQKFGLSNAKPLDIQDKFRGEGKVYADQSGSLTIFAQTISYQKVGFNPTKGPFDPDISKQQAASDLKKFGLNGKIGNSPSVSYSKIQEETFIDLDSPQDADLIDLVFNYEIESRPLITQTSPISVTYDSQGNLFTLRYFSIPQLEASKEYPIVQSNEAVAALKKIKNPLVKIEPFSDVVSSTSSIQQINIKTQKLAYVLNTSDEITQPVWLFEGTGNIAGINFKATAVVPAIYDKFFKNPTTKP